MWFREKSRVTMVHNTHHEYRKFAEDWNFNHTTTSPYHPQAEQAVQTTHNLLTKAKEMEKIHTWVFWSTGTLQSTISQAQMLMSRRLRSTIPTTKSQLQPRVIEEKLANSKLKSKQILQKFYFDRGSKKLQNVYQEEKVRVGQGDKWNHVVITGSAETPRSFYVKTLNGNSYQRNRKHVQKTEEQQSDLA